MSLYEDREPDPKYYMPSKKKGKCKRPVFTRGYQESRDRLSKNSFYSRSCFNCDYYYQASGDKQETCQNSEVLQYDMIITEKDIYCLKWRHNSNNQQSLFKKNGRSQLD